jgi:hypothetical protein
MLPKIASSLGFSRCQSMMPYSHPGIRRRTTASCAAAEGQRADHLPEATGARDGAKALHCNLPDRRRHRSHSTRIARGAARGATPANLPPTLRRHRIMDINLPDTVAEVQAAFSCYEVALMSNDTATLQALFWHSPHTIRYGIGEILHGWDEIGAFRAARSPVGLARALSRTVITTFGRDFATASTLFHRATAAGKVGRQMQTWARMPEGWRIVAAHVSLIDA